MKTLFPQTLKRLDYALRFVLWFIGVPVIAAFLLPLPKYIGIPEWLPIVIIILLIPLRFPCADIPRFRSFGWSPWLVLLLFIPLVNLYIQLMLFIAPAKETDA
jgi:hypothetical protein